MADRVSLSLDDIIKMDKIKSRKPRAGGAASSRNNRGAPRSSALKNLARRSGLAGAKKSGQGIRQQATKQSPGGKWRHDLYTTVNNDPSMRPKPAHLLVSNLDGAVSDKDIRELFSECGRLLKAAVHFDRNGRGRGTADVVFANKADAAKAIAKYNRVPLDGRPMQIVVVADPNDIKSRIGQRSGGGVVKPTRNNSQSRSRDNNNRNKTRGPNKGGKTGGNRGPKQPKKTLTADELDRDLEAYVASAQ